VRDKELFTRNSSGTNDRQLNYKVGIERVLN